MADITPPMDSERIRQVTQDALADMIAKLDPGAMLTRYIVLAEVVDAEGRRALWSGSAPDQKTWDTMGLLDYARAVEYAATAKDEAEEE